MKYSFNQNEFPGTQQPPIYPCDFLDGDGKLLNKSCIFVDTETGEIIYYQYIPNGGGIILDDNDMPKRFYLKAKPPLTIVPYPYEPPKPDVVV